MKPIPAFYIPDPSPFPVLEDFIYEATKAYNLDLFLCRGDRAEAATAPTHMNRTETKPPAHLSNGKPKGGNNMKEALEAYKRRFPRIEGILIGTRRTDPHGGKSHLNIFYATLLEKFLISQTVISHDDGPRLATIRSYTPHHKLVLPGRLGIPSKTGRSLLLSI